MSQGPDLSLSRDQEDLLRTALASNPKGRSSGSLNTSDNSLSIGTAFSSMANGQGVYASPSKTDPPGSGHLNGMNESPFLDYELEDGQFDWDDSQENLFGDLPGSGSADGEHHDKRKASIDNENGEEGTNKRREGEEKQAKKPGRKPLTAEPTTKRKAQNRAAQRAFRERKERHLKDLETKVEDLEKASEATNHENGRLRAQVEKLNTELREYRKRISLIGPAPNPSPPLSASASRGASNPNDFSFAFPKFGDLPSSFINNGSMARTSSKSPAGNNPASSPTAVPNVNSAVANSATSPNGDSPGRHSTSYASPMGSAQATGNSFVNDKFAFGATDFKDLTGLFSPSVLENASRSNSADYLSYNGGTSGTPSVRHDSTSTVNAQSPAPRIQRNSSASIIASPTSSMSQNGLDSSCGTTPESSPDSPDHQKAAEPTLKTISEEGANQNKQEATFGVPKSPGADINGIDWMAQQNGGQFDPVLFGDYRDSHDNILNNTFGDFFNDAFPSPQDFTSPYNTGDLYETVQPQPQKRDLMKEIEIQQNGGPDTSLNGGNKSDLVNYEKLWDRLENSQKYQSGENNLDDLCSQLKAKARCSETGAVIEKKEVDKILGPPGKEGQDLLKMFS